MATPLLILPVVWILALPLRLIRPTGLLAMRNVMRNPRRTAVTASALTVGVALVILGSVMAASMKASTSSIIEDQLKSDLLVMNMSMKDIPDSVVTKIEDTPGVKDVNSSLHQGPMNIRLSHECSGNKPCFDGAKKQFVTVGEVRPDSLGRDFTMPVKQGDLAPYREQNTPQVLVSEKYAKDHDIEVGDEIEFLGNQKTLTATVAARVNSQVISTNVIVTPQFAEEFGMDTVLRPVILVNLDKKDEASQIQTKIMDELKKDNPLLVVYTKAQYKDFVAKQVNNILAFVYSLLGLSILIAVFGIINTQSMSVTERIREIGLLRAVGYSRSQTSLMVIMESVLTSVFGSLMGFAVGFVVSRALFVYLQATDSGLDIFAFPTQSLLQMILGGIVIGIVAGLLPAIRAARIPLLQAIAHEE